MSITVGKIITRPAQDNQYGRDNPEESIEVLMDIEAVVLKVALQDVPGVRERLRADTVAVVGRLTPVQTIELGQMLLKAAEVQPEYAVAYKRLAEEQANLASKYKDMISGLGLENPDLKSGLVDL